MDLDGVHMRICTEDPKLESLCRIWDIWRKTQHKGRPIPTLVFTCSLGQRIADSIFADFITEVRFPDGREFHSEFYRVFMKRLKKYLYLFMWITREDKDCVRANYNTPSRKALRAKLKSLNDRDADKIKFDEIHELEMDLWISEKFGVHSTDSFTDTICFYIMKIFGFSSIKALTCLKTNHFDFGEDAYGQYVEITDAFEKDYLSEHTCDTTGDPMEEESNGMVLHINGNKRLRHYRDKSNPKSFYILIKHYIKVLRELGIRNMFVNSVRYEGLTFPKLRFNGVDIVEEEKSPPMTTTHLDIISIRLIENVRSRKKFFSRKDISEMIVPKLSNLGFLVDNEISTVFCMTRFLKICKALDTPSQLEFEIANIGNEQKRSLDADVHYQSVSPAVMPSYFQMELQHEDAMLIEIDIDSKSNVVSDHMFQFNDQPYPLYLTENTTTTTSPDEASGLTRPSSDRISPRKETSKMLLKRKSMENLLNSGKPPKSKYKSKMDSSSNSNFFDMVEEIEGNGDPMLTQSQDDVHIRTCFEEPAMQSLSKLWTNWRIAHKVNRQSVKMQKLPQTYNNEHVITDARFTNYLLEIKFHNGKEFHIDHLDSFFRDLHEYLYQVTLFKGETMSRIQLNFGLSGRVLDGKLKYLNSRTVDKEKFDELVGLEIDLWNSKMFGIHSKESFTDTMCFYFVKIFGFSSRTALYCLKTNHLLFGEDTYGQYVEITNEFEREYMYQRKLGSIEGKRNGVVLEIKGKKRFRHYRDQSNPRSFYSLIKYYIKVLKGIGISNLFSYSVNSGDLIFPKLRFDGEYIVEEEASTSDLSQTKINNAHLRIIENIGSRSTVFDRNDISKIVLSKLTKIRISVPENNRSKVFGMKKYLKLCKVLDCPSSVSSSDLNLQSDMPTVVTSYFKKEFLAKLPVPYARKESNAMTEESNPETTNTNSLHEVTNHEIYIGINPTANNITEEANHVTMTEANYVTGSPDSHHKDSDLQSISTNNINKESRHAIIDVDSDHEDSDHESRSTNNNAEGASHEITSSDSHNPDFESCFGFETLTSNNT